MPVLGRTALSAAKWMGTVTGVVGAVIIAANLGMVVFGFAFFLVSSLLWSMVGWIQREVSLLVLQGPFTVINVIGIWRWTGACQVSCRTWPASFSPHGRSEEHTLNSSH